MRGGLPSSGRRFLLAALAVAAALLLLEAAWRQLSGWASGAHEAAWIWAEPGADDARTVTFYAVRDFDLDEPPGDPTICLLADEEVHLFLNGVLVASRRYRAGDRAVSLPVGDLLRPGANRLVAELRSETGVGGFLLRLDGEAGPVVATDESWSIAWRYEPGLLEAGGPLPRLEAPRVWGRAPTGRWRLGRPEPLLRVAARPLDGGPRLARRVRVGDSESWERLQGDADWRSLPLGRRVTFDWGETIVASVNLVFAKTETGRGFFWASDRPARRHPWPPSGYFRKAPGGRSWTSTEMHAFRYLTIWSDTDLVGVRAFRFDARSSGLRLATAVPPAGVAGLDPPHRSRPALERMWAQLERAEARAARAADEAAEAGSP